jgi:hypothetical protein
MGFFPFQASLKILFWSPMHWSGYGMSFDSSFIVAQAITRHGFFCCLFFAGCTSCLKLMPRSSACSDLLSSTTTSFWCFPQLQPAQLLTMKAQHITQLYSILYPTWKTQLWANKLTLGSLQMVTYWLTTFQPSFVSTPPREEWYHYLYSKSNMSLYCS